MSSQTVIEWTDSTWNPWRGCDKVSPGCAHCYMFRDQKRYGGDPSIVTRCSDNTFYAPIRSRKWAAHRDECLKAHGRHLVFTCSWSDWFHEDADEWRDEAWSIIRNTPESTYQILTKRPERIADHLPREWGEGWPNVWLGVSIENRRFVERADTLRKAPAAVRFISAEPLLGPLVPHGRSERQGGPGEHFWDWGGLGQLRDEGLDLTGIDWVIVGGESGPKHRRMDPEWVRDLLKATRCAGCNGSGIGDHGADPDPICHGCQGHGQLPNFLFKQWGGPRPESGGRKLDGRTWDEFPEVVRDG